MRAIAWPIQGKAAFGPPFFFAWPIERECKARMAKCEAGIREPASGSRHPGADVRSRAGRRSERWRRSEKSRQMHKGLPLDPLQVPQSDIVDADVGALVICGRCRPSPCTTALGQKGTFTNVAHRRNRISADDAVKSGSKMARGYRQIISRHTEASTSSASCANVAKCRSGSVTVLGAGVAPKPSSVWRRSIQHVA